MPISVAEFNKGFLGPNEIEKLLRKNPDRAYSLHEEAIIGKEMNRQKHLDVFIADLTMLTPLIFETQQIECRVVDGIPHFRWTG
jgi:uncharacterized protein VirK/YbjX